MVNRILPANRARALPCVAQDPEVHRRDIAAAWTSLAGERVNSEILTSNRQQHDQDLSRTSRRACAQVVAGEGRVVSRRRIRLVAGRPGEASRVSDTGPP